MSRRAQTSEWPCCRRASWLLLLLLLFRLFVFPFIGCLITQMSLHCSRLSWPSQSQFLNVFVPERNVCLLSTRDSSWSSSSGCRWRFKRGKKWFYPTRIPVTRRENNKQNGKIEWRDVTLGARRNPGRKSGKKQRIKGRSEGYRLVYSNELKEKSCWL